MSTKPDDVRDNSVNSAAPWRLAVVLSHPVQYFAPLFRRLAQRPEIDLTVLYSTLEGARAAMDPGFGLSVAWDIPLLEGYRYKELGNVGLGRKGRVIGYVSPRVISELRSGRYDAAIVYGWGELTSWLAFWGAHLSRTPWMLFGETTSIVEKDKGWMKRKIRRPLLRFLFRRTGAFLVSGGFNQPFYESYGVPASMCFPAPEVVDNDFFAGGAEAARRQRAELRARHGIPPEAVVILFVGKLIPRKRPQDVLAVLEKLKPLIPAVAAAFVGEGKLRPELEAGIRNQGLSNAFLLGFKNQSELPGMYAISDVFVLPSEEEVRGLVAHEAMACGLPVVVSDKTGVWGPGDIVRDGVNGFVYPAGDVTALERILFKLCSDRDLRARMGNESSRIIQSFSYDQCVKGILQALSSIRVGSAR